ncbi:MAG: hypothetical protein DMF59_14245 [Acidobacteria bacterium]|nr:MAG: hypothetical protein DMF59_14245 [Acidobacteriota bacterium]
MFVTETGLSLYFASDRSGGQGGLDIYVSHRNSINDPWGAPQNLGTTINSTADDHCSFVTPDGHQLFFVSSRDGGQGMGDFYVSFRANTQDDSAWSTPQNVTELNSSSDEFSPTPFRDPRTGRLTIFFNSNRPGGLGGYDIYTATEQSNGKFSTPTMVAELSSPQNDQFPMINPGGLEIILRSDRPGGLGGFDFWMSDRATLSDTWSPPRNIGAPINTSVAEQRPSIYAGGTRLAFAANNRPGGVGGLDLWESTRTRTSAIPVVGSVTGFSGTVFKTSGQISNATGSTISGNLVFHPAGASPSSSDPTIAYTLNPFETRTFADLMSAFGTSGLGWLEIVPATGLAPAALMTIQDGGVVTVPGVADSNIIRQGTHAVLVTPSDVNQFRMNIGVRTFDNGAAMTITVYDAAGNLVRSNTRSFPANYFAQFGAADLAGGPIAARQTLVFSVDSGSAVIYGSTVANGGGGSTLQMAQRIEP